MSNMLVPRRWLFLAAAGIVALAVFWCGCSEDLPLGPGENPQNVLTANFMTLEDYRDTGIEINGERIDREWGSAFTPDREFLNVRVSAENGRNFAGPPRYIAMKALYTEGYIFFLVQWVDEQPDELKDVFMYTGPSLNQPIVNCVEIDGLLQCDSLYREGDEDSLLTPNWWRQFGDDDKFAIAFEMDAATGNGYDFGSGGCQIACHGNANGQFGAMDSGRLDLWYWMAGRTNPIRDLFYFEDDPNDATHGIPGYMDDLYIDNVAGIVPDEGIPGYEENFIAGRGYPRFVYRLDNDQLNPQPGQTTLRNAFGEQARLNNGVFPNYIWRENPTSLPPAFNAEDIFNETIVPDARLWETGDLVGGYLLTYPSDSRADVYAKGNFDPEQGGIWILEIGRKLETATPNQDVIFDPEAGKRYAFTVSLFDAATETHWGSETQYLEFAPMSVAEED